MMAGIIRQARFWAVAMALAVSTAPALGADESGKLVAPLYPGAKIIDDGKKCGETSKWYWDVCEQFSADNPEKVQAFYEGKVGKRFQPARTVEGESIRWAPLAWYHSLGEDGEADVFPGITLRAKITPPWPATDAQRFVSKSRYFRGFEKAVNWTGDTSPYTQGWHTPQDVQTVYAKYGYLESRYFVDAEALNNLDRKYEALASDRVEKVKAQQSQRQKQETAAAEQRSQQMAAESQSMVQSGGGPEAQQDRAEMDALMQRKPGLWAKAKPHYDKGKAIMDEAMAAAQSGKDYPKSKMKQGEAEMKQANDILRTDPEVAALQDKQMARADARAKERQTRMMQGMPTLAGLQASTQADNKAHADALWSTWSAYLAEVAQLPSYQTLVEVSHARSGEGKDYSSKPDVVNQKLAAKGGKVQLDKGNSGAVYADDKVAAKKAAAASGSAAEGKKEEKKPAKNSAADDATDSAKKAGKEGLKLLKKLF